MNTPTLTHIPPLEAEVRTMLKRRRGHWPAIAQEAQVSYSWLTNFAANRTIDAGVRKLENLKSIMSGVPETVE